MLLQFPGPNPNEVDLTPTYDAVVVGSGAAGGMAAYVLTTHGFKVLLLEAGKYQDTGKILHSMEWPYDHPRRGKMPADYHALTLNEYNVRELPYAQNSQYSKVQSYVQGWSGTDYSKTLVVDDEFAMLDVLTEHIIPRDAHSPGARDAGVAAYIDRTVARAFLPEEKESWKKGLAEINRLSVEGTQHPFLKAGKSGQIALLQKLAQGENDPKTDGERFFTQLKRSTVFGYHSSEIGIHKDMEYKGNVILEQFAGYDAV
jgi:monoamine oxidase